MNIDWVNFTPWTSLAGGLLIGLATVLLLLFNGRIAGISGIVGGLLSPKRGEIAWCAAFVVGLIASPIAFSVVRPLPSVQIEASYFILAIAGLLVGVGTRFGSGCTSGHGVCGLSRRSPRSLVATTTFMLAGFFTVYIVRHVFG